MKNFYPDELKAFNSVDKEISDLYHAIGKQLGLSDSAFTILYGMVLLGNDCLQIDIVNQFHITKQTINSSVRNLEKQGYIQLRKGKGRDMHLSLTPLGEQVVEEKIYPVIQVEIDFVKEMPAEQMQIYLQLSQEYTARLKRYLHQMNQSVKK